MELSVFNQQLEKLQNVMIQNASNEDRIYGNGKDLVNNKDFPITHDFSDQLYMRKMKMQKGSLVISTYHHTDHFWFLLEGTIEVNTGGEVVKHIAPCYEKSIKGAKRIIVCIEDCLFINVHKNPSNTKSLKEVEENLYSFTVEEYNKKELKNK
jgi:hypothetical protein|tara:strand:+ start:650 stop:1108 length:459 start_codon:yes stop_codon:yes gene_type:complete